MAEEVETVTIKLSPEQMEYIKKTYLGILERVIQERQAIKAKMEFSLKHLAGALDLYSKLPFDLRSIIANMSVLEALKLIKQVYDSIEVEEVEDETPDSPPIDP